MSAPRPSIFRNTPNEASSNLSQESQRWARMAATVKHIMELGVPDLGVTAQTTTEDASCAVMGMNS